MESGFWVLNSRSYKKWLLGSHEKWLLQTSSEEHGKRSSCILLLGSRTSFFHGFNGVVRTLRRRPPAQVERQRKQVYITLHLSDLSLSGFYDVIRT